MTEPKTVTVVWTTQYYLTVTSAYGNPQGAGWYNAGATASWSVTNPHPVSDGVRRFTDDPTSGEFVMDSPKSVTVSWRLQYRLITAANPPEQGSVDPSGENWYDADSVAHLTVTPNVGYVFYWSGNLSGIDSPKDLLMDGPKIVTANFVLMPIADFSASPRSAIAPSLTVQFTDESAGSITSWEWDFDNDGTVDSTLPTPDPYTYASAGRYTVKLTVTGLGGGHSETKTDYIRVCNDADAIYVRTGGLDTNDGLSWATAKKTIQAGINTASADWSVRVAKGTYNIAGDYNLDFAGKAVHLKGVTAGGSYDVGADWIIDGQNTSGRQGVIFQTNEGAHSVVDNFTIQRCIAPAGEDGGAIYCTGASPTIINCRIGGATSGNKGENAGGIYCGAGSNLTITDCIIKRNAATAGNGGGIYCDASSPRISGCTIGVAGQANTAAGNNGGGIYCYNSNPRITNNCTIEANEADGGAGIYCSGSSPLIANCTIKDNLASGAAGTGGGICLFDGSNATITNCAIYGNSAAYYGGGIYSESSTPAITNCTIGAAGANSASDIGGGIWLYISSPAIANCVITNNAATNVGGAIYCDAGSCPAITNCLIANNSTTAGTSIDGGGGIYCTASSNPTITNCTIANNTAATNGGGIYCFVSSPVLNNTILWGNTTTLLGHQIYTWKSPGPGGTPCTVTLNYSNYANGTGDIEGTGTVTANNCINSDPLFFDAGSGDYHLDSTTPSPCIDAGSDALVPTGVTTDLDGLPRIAGTAVDMGAYEYQP
jgi:PKD repeat protein